jgi:putative ABC transport system substrate-binding protein
MQRREFITLLGGATVTWARAARGQQPAAIRRVGVLVASAEDDADIQGRLAGFRQGLERRGWSNDRVHIETRFAAGRGDQFLVLAKELIALHPDVILAHSTPRSPSRCNERATQFRSCSSPFPTLLAQGWWRAWRVRVAT